METEGRTFRLPGVVAKIADLSQAKLLAANVNGRSYSAAPDLQDGGSATCFVAIPAKAAVDPVIGCDSPEDLVAKGG